jgi:CubicO group peptidase (beta-lactamase class C family)
MKLARVENCLSDAIVSGAFPGAAFAVSHKGKLERRYLGRQTYCPESPEIDAYTMWDLASLTKVVATTSVAMRLHDDHKLNLDQPVAEILPEFAQQGKDQITFRNLLLHDSGLAPDLLDIESLYEPKETIEAVMAEKLEYETGTKMVYSDLGMITLGLAMQRITGHSLEQLVADHVWKPAGMKHSRYSPAALDPRTQNPQSAICARCAPTEVLDPWRRKLRDNRFTTVQQSKLFGKAPDYIQAEVHDPTAAVMGGVAGHAGMFANLSDVVRFMNALHAGQIASHSTVREWTTCQTDLSSRALGWDTKSEPSSAGTMFGPRSYGHTGYTGTSIWCDPEQELFAILLTNRVHPTSENTKIMQVRPQFHDAVYQAVI